MALIACFFNASMASMVKVIIQEFSLPNQVLVFFRFGFSFLLLLPILALTPKYRPLSSTLKMKIWPPYVVRMIAGLLCIYVYFYSIQKISLSLAVLFTATAPLFIPLVVWIWRGVPVQKNLWWALSIGFIGVIFIVGPEFSTLNIGYLAGLFSGIFAAISFVSLRVQSHSESPISINFYFFLGAALMAFIFSAKTLVLSFPSYSLKLWIYLFLLGLFGALSQGAMSIAFKWAQARFVGAYLYSTVAFAFIIEWLLFNKMPTVWMILGMVLIICGGVLMSLLNPHKQAESE